MCNDSPLNKGGKVAKHIFKYLVLAAICGIVVYLPMNYLVRTVNKQFEAYINEEAQKDFDVLDDITKKIEEGENPKEDLENIDSYNFQEDGNILSLEEGLAKLTVHMDSDNNIESVSRLTTKGVYVFIFSSASFVAFTIAFIVCEVLLVRKADKLLSSKQITDEVKNTKE